MRRVTRWLEAIPHPLLACEIAPGYVAAARWTRGGTGLDGFAVEPLPEGAIVPSAVESNLANAAAVRGAGGSRPHAAVEAEEECAVRVGGDAGLLYASSTAG